MRSCPRDIFLIIVLLLSPSTNAKIVADELTAEMLNKSLQLGTQFLINNQKPAGNFQYQYDWRLQEYSSDDNQVRQAGAGWGLALIHKFQPSKVMGDAVEKALDFMNEHSRLTEKGERYVVYPGTLNGQTGTVALVALAHLDYLQSAQLTDRQREKYRPYLAGYLRFLASAVREDGRWHAHYDLVSGEPYGESSPYADGEALLALIKAAKYDEFEIPHAELIGWADAGYKQNVRQARARNADSSITKGYYQWSSMAFYELATSGWEGTERFGDYVIELADWMIDVHRTLERTRNTAYAYEGIIHAYQLAKSKGDHMHQEKLASVIEQGVRKLTSWQVGHPIANEYILAGAADDAHAIGGIQNHESEAALRIDVTQHQMHAVMLALKYYVADR